MKSLLLLVDSRRYIRDNCYQQQLFETLSRNFRVRTLSLKEMRFLPFVRIASYDVVLSVLRARTLQAFLKPLRRLLGTRDVMIYDQDPWQSFMDESPYKGGYTRVMSELNVRRFLVTSQWWSQWLEAKGFPVEFVRMGMLPAFCDAGPSWEERSIHLGFQGTLHPHRRAFYDQLKLLGLDVEVLPSASYANYLKALHSMRVFVHTEDAPWVVDGETLQRNSLWIKETEVAARGTFAIRDYEVEAEAYGIGELPTVFPYRRVEDVPSIVATIEGMSPQERRERMETAVETMRRRDDWMTVVRALDA